MQREGTKLASKRLKNIKNQKTVQSWLELSGKWRRKQVLLIGASLGFCDEEIDVSWYYTCVDLCLRGGIVDIRANTVKEAQRRLQNRPFASY